MPFIDACKQMCVKTTSSDTEAILGKYWDLLVYLFPYAKGTMRADIDTTEESITLSFSSEDDPVKIKLNFEETATDVKRLTCEIISYKNIAFEENYKEYFMQTTYNDLPSKEGIAKSIMIWLGKSFISLDGFLERMKK